MIDDPPTRDGLEEGRQPRTVVDDRGDRLDLTVHLPHQIADVIVSMSESGLRVEGRPGPGGRLAPEDGIRTISVELAVPPGFDRTGVVASFEPGVLRLSVPRSATV